MNTKKIINIATYTIIASGLIGAGYSFYEKQQLTKENKLLNSQLNKANEINNALSSDKKFITIKLNESLEKINSYQNSIKDLQREISEREEEYKILVEVNNKISLSNKLLSQEITDLKLKIKEIDKVRFSIESVVKLEETKNDGLNNELNKTRELLNSIESENKSLIKKIDNLNSKIKSNEFTINNITQEIERKNEEIISLNEKNKRIKKEFEDISRAIKDEANELLKTIREDSKDIEDAEKVNESKTNIEIHKQGISILEDIDAVLIGFKNQDLKNPEKVNQLITQIIKVINQRYIDLYPIFTHTNFKNDLNKTYHSIYFSKEASFDEKNAVRLLSIAETIKKLIDSRIPDNHIIQLLPSV